MAKKTFMHTALVLQVTIILLFSLSYMFQKKASTVQGPTRIVQGPQGMVYILMDGQIIKASAEGKVLATLDVERDMAVHEPIADIFVEHDAKIVVGLKNSQLINTYTPEGKLICTHTRKPSPRVNGIRDFQLVKDSLSGFLYVADTVHNRLQIYGPDGKEVITLSNPSGVKQEDQSKTSDSQEEVCDTCNPGRRFLHPHGVLFDQDRLYLADTGNKRIVIFYADGSLDRIIRVIADEADTHASPWRLVRSKNRLLIINRAEHYKGGILSAVNLDNDASLFCSLCSESDPVDILARVGDLLIADRLTKTVRHCAINGKPLGVFGDSSLQRFYSALQTKIAIYTWARNGFFTTAWVVWLCMIVIRRIRRKKQAESGQEDFYQPFSFMQRILGPLGSGRRKALIIIAPGLGQLAAGRILRAGLFLLPLTLLLLQDWPRIHLNDLRTSSYEFFTFIVSLSALFALWTWASVDGLRLSALPVRPHRFGFKKMMLTLGTPLLTAAGAWAGQLVWKGVTTYLPQKALLLQKIFQNIVHFLSFLVVTNTGSFEKEIWMVFGWGGAIAGLTAALTLRTQPEWKKVAVACCKGGVIGLISWTLALALVNPITDLRLLLFVVNGAIVGFLLYLFHGRKQKLTAFIVAASVSGAWLGELMLAGTLGLILNKIYHVMVLGYCMHLAILLTLNALHPPEDSHVLQHGKTSW